MLNFTGFYKNYPGEWVALKDDEKTVIASGKTASEALQASKKSGHTSPILFRVPSKISLSISVAIILK